MLNTEENLIIQSYCNVALFVELINNDFLESTFFDNMNFSLPGIKKSIKNDIGLSNQGMVLISLYVLLVIPRQLIGDKFNVEYKEIGCFLDVVTQNTKTTYKKEDPDDKKTIDFLTHIRNAVAHSRISFPSNETVTFSDKRGNKNSKRVERFSTTIHHN